MDGWELPFGSSTAGAADGDTGMPPGKKIEVEKVLPETLLYGVLVAGFCIAAIRLLGNPLHELFQHHRIEYATAGLLLMVAQGYGLERLAHAICSLFYGKGKSPP
jgi:hypothetical protein